MGLTESMEAATSLSMATDTGGTGTARTGTTATADGTVTAAAEIHRE
jgi:hypothetical protein